MNKEEFDINQELEQMRQDYAALKERFDKQQIINEKLMEKAFKSDVRWLSTDKQSGLIAGALGIPLVIVISIIRHIDWWFPAAVSFFIVIAIWARGGHPLRYQEGQTLQTAVSSVFLRIYDRGRHPRRNLCPHRLSQLEYS